MKSESTVSCISCKSHVKPSAFINLDNNTVWQSQAAFAKHIGCSRENVRQMLLKGSNPKRRTKASRPLLEYLPPKNICKKCEAKRTNLYDRIESQGGFQKLGLALDLNEESKLVEGFSEYAVTTKGRLFSHKTGFWKELSTDRDSKNYVHIRLSSDSESQYVNVHRLVAAAFLPNPDNLPQVNHKDMDRTNNSVENLEWVSASENIQHAIENQKHAVHGKTAVYVRDFNKLFPSQSSAAKELGLTTQQVNRIVTGRTKNPQYTIEYADKVGEK